MDTLKNDDFISLFDIELGKFSRANKCDNIVAIISNETKLRLEESPQFTLYNEKNGVHYIYRGMAELIIDNNLDLDETQYYFMIKEEYDEKK